MPKLSFGDYVGIMGIIFAIILVVLDKAGKLKGPMLLVLLGVAAVMTLPLVLGSSWFVDAASGMLKFARGMLLVCSVGMMYALIAVWISDSPSPPVVEPTPASAPIKTPVAPISDAELEKSKETGRKAGVDAAAGPTKPDTETHFVKDGIKAEVKKPFLFVVDVALFAPSYDHNVGMWFGYKSPHGDSISPANAALYLRLVNLQDIPSRISGYDIEVQAGGKWTEAKMFDTRFGNVYMIVKNDFKGAAKIANDDGLDVKFAAKSYVLQPKETIEGWVLLEYPKEIIMFSGFYKLSVSDELGHSWEGIVTAPKPDQKNSNFLGGALRGIAIEDVSAFRKKYYSDP